MTTDNNSNTPKPNPTTPERILQTPPLTDAASILNDPEDNIYFIDSSLASVQLSLMGPSIDAEDRDRLANVIRMVRTRLPITRRKQ